jgi:hypothetical protein
MEKRGYINVVKEQLRAYDFCEIQDDDIEEIENEVYDNNGEELTSEEKEVISNHSLFVRFHENGVVEEVTIVELDEETVDEIKTPIRKILPDDIDQEIEQDEEISESHDYFLFVTDSATKPLHTVTENYTFEGERHAVISILADMGNEEIYFKDEFGLFEHSPFLRIMSETVPEYFAVST